MRERPVIFNADSVRAIIAGTKVQTRRLVKPQPGPLARFYKQDSMGAFGWSDNTWRRCPLGTVGQRLWVRETWTPADSIIDGVERDEPVIVAYRADSTFLRWEGTPGVDCPTVEPEWGAEDLDGVRWKSPIFLPRWASRLLLEVTAVRVERLQAISEADCIAEGFVPYIGGDGQGPGATRWQAAAVDAFRAAWDALHARKGNGWEADPWVWAVVFRLAAGLAAPAGEGG